MGEAGQAHLVLGGAEGQAGSRGRQVEAADPRGALAGPHEGGVEVGLAAMADPGLGAAEVIALGRPLGPAGHPGDIRPGLGLRQRVRPELPAAEHARQVRAPLGPGPEAEHRVGRHHVHRDADADGHPGGGHLLQRLQIHLVRLPGPAVLLRIGQREQADLAQQSEGVAGKRPAASSSAARGASSAWAISRTRPTSSAASSVGSRRSTVISLLSVVPVRVPGYAKQPTEIRDVEPDAIL